MIAEEKEEGRTKGDRKVESQAKGSSFISSCEKDWITI